jgi:molybdate transport system substrate-binding protein
MRLARTALSTLSVGAVVLLAACSGGGTADDPTTAAATTDTAATETALSGNLTVYAAASLQETFEELGATFEAENPDVTVTFNFGASSALAQQIDSGAPVDVFAAANTSTMESVDALTDDPEVFVRNSLEIVVPAGNPGQVTGLADFANEELAIALCAEDVPCGSAAIKAFEAAGITPAPDTYEKDVTATLTKAVLGEVDAALVYRTDVISAGDSVEGIEFPEASAALNDYPIATLKDAANPDAAAAFKALVLSSAGQKVLTDAGFDAA